MIDAMRYPSIVVTWFGLMLIGCPATSVGVGGSSVGDDGTATSSSDGLPDTGTDSTSGDGDGVEDHRTYFIAESTKFDGGGSCDNSKLNTITNTLRNELVDAGWAGLRFVDDNAWPEDFRERTLSDLAQDDIFGDATRLSIYAGHGAMGQLQWGRPSDNGACRTTINLSARLGRLAGDTAAATMFMTSCTLRVDQLWPTFKEQACRQFFGYHDSPYIGYDEARKVFKRSADGQPTADAWLEEMVLNVGKNSPVVFTMGTSPDDASSVHGVTNLASGEGFIENVGEPADNFFYEFFNSGCTKGCGNCTGSAIALPEITPTGALPLVKLSRPLRSAVDLVDQVSALLVSFDIDPLDQDTQGKLEAWADAVVTRGDVTYAQILDEPRVDVSYDPSSDLLRVTSRDALARARPGPGSVVDDLPDLDQTLRPEAELVRAQLQPLLGPSDLFTSEFQVTTREIGYGGGEGLQPDPIAFEYTFMQYGELEGLALPDHSLGIGLTRLGELSTLTLSRVEVEVTGAVGVQRTPQQALDALTAAVVTQYPSALDPPGVELVAPRVGYQLGEGETTRELVPSLLLGYVLAFGPADDPMISRRVPVRVSLVELDAPIESLAATDPNPHEGDERGSN